METKKLFLYFFYFLISAMLVYPKLVYSQYLNSDEEQRQLSNPSRADSFSSAPRVQTIEREISDRENTENYNRFVAQDFLFFFGAGYGTEGFLNYKKLKENYTTKTKNLIPPLSFGIEYSILDFLSLGAEFNYYKFNSVTIPQIDFNMFLLKFRTAFHYSFSRLNLYLGGNFGTYILNIPDTTKLLEANNIGGITFSGFFGFRVFLVNTLFLYAETAYPFPLATAGIGIKL